jgi:hypothetical protein
MRRTEWPADYFQTPATFIEKTTSFIALIRHGASLPVADESAESMKNGSNQVKVKGKDVIKVLGVKLEGVDSISSLHRVYSRITVKSRHGPKGLRFTHLTH